MLPTTATSGVTSARVTFARRLRELRVPRGFRTARSLAQAIGIDENRYTRYERAEVEPDLGLLMKICDVLGLTPNDLLMEGAMAGQAIGTEPSMHGSRRQPFSSSAQFAPPGFAETPQAGFGEAVPPAEQLLPSATAAALKRRTIAWQLARLACAHGVAIGTAAPGAGGEFSSVQRTSRVFAAIERDPFTFVTAMAGNERITALPATDQRRIASLIDDLMAAVDAAAQGVPALPPGSGV